MGDGRHGSGMILIYYTLVVSERLVYNKSNELHIIMEICLSVGVACTVSVPDRPGRR